MWFEELMGFDEESPEQVRENIEVDGEFLVSRVNGRRVRFGQLLLPSLAELRTETSAIERGRPAQLIEILGDIRAIHREPDNAGALFQAASQFNLLEMVDYDVPPEAGVGIYERDGTQGPSCAIACGGGTIYRNYFAPVGGVIGQSKERQIDCLEALHGALGGPGLWEMRNGYALPSVEGLERINAKLDAASADERDALRGLLRVGVQRNVEVLGSEHVVTQVYGAAMPVDYGEPPAPLWEPLARLVLEASYEATFRVAQRYGIAKVFLTRLGGGVFRNDDAWIDDSILRALDYAGGLDVRIVSYGRRSEAVARLLRRYEEP